MIFRFIYTRRRRTKPSGPQIEELRTQAKAYLPGRLSTLAAEYGFTFNRVFIKNNLTNWGSCSTRGNVNLNLRLMHLPSDLQDYVILHELCHLKHLNHGPEFHSLLDGICTARGLGSEKELRRRLKEYHTI